MNLFLIPFKVKPKEWGGKNFLKFMNLKNTTRAPNTHVQTDTLNIIHLFRSDKKTSHELYVQVYMHMDCR
jgi:hypothetical protein